MKSRCWSGRIACWVLLFSLTLLERQLSPSRIVPWSLSPGWWQWGWSCGVAHPSGGAAG
ncbi:MAG: hypothetical protein ACFB51_01890 [Anaerolineae bacterium]